MTYARVIADSIGPDGTRLVTIEGQFHRFVLAEANTHRVISKNSASSRAIPFTKQVQRIRDDLAYPVVWASEQKGMQGGDEIEDPQQAETWWSSAAENAIQSAEAIASLGVHKSLVNRLLEPFQMHRVIFTATAWDNFFDQRCSPLAQPEIRVFAEAAREAMLKSTPEELREGKWHLPYVEFGVDDYAVADHLDPEGVADPDDVRKMLVKISAARCARVSYLTQDGKRDIQADLDLYERLTTAQPPHWSPLEHVATPWPENRQDEGRRFFGFYDIDGYTREVPTGHLPRVGNLLGWRSLRTEIETIQGQVTYR